MNAARSSRFRTVALDVDTTLCGIEGLDWIAALRGPEIAHRITQSTDRAMRGEVAVERIYAERLDLVRPSQDEVARLGVAYTHVLAPGAKESIARWMAGGVRVVLISSGIRQAIVHVAREVGIDERDVNAVSLRFADNGDYSGFDEASPLATTTGKREVLSGLSVPRPVLAVGDGFTDIAMGSAADAFVAFTGFIARAEVVAKADFTAASFEELTRAIL